MKLTIVKTEANQGELPGRLAEIVSEAPVGHVIQIKPPTRNLEQNAKFHAICSDIARQKPFAGKHLTVDQWKVLLVSGHAVATKQGADVMPGLEGEFVNIRESTASMSVSRLSSLIEYSLAWGAENGVRFTY